MKRLLYLLLPLFLATSAGRGFGQDSTLSNTVRLPTSRELDHQLGQAQHLEEDARWEDAARLYEAILAANRSSDDGNRVYQIGERRYRGVSAIIHERLAAWPAEGQAAYRRLFDVSARARLDEAVSRGSEDDLWSLVHDYPIATPAVEALLRIADLAIERGDAISGERAIDSALRIRGAAPTDPGIQVRRAACALYRNEPDAARSLALPLDADGTPAAVRTLAHQIVLRAEALLTAPRRPEPSVGSRWPLVLGTPAGWAAVDRPFTLGPRRWFFPFGGRVLSNGLREVTPRSSVTPVAAGGRVLLATGQVVHALEIGSGTLLWPGLPPDHQTVQETNDRLLLGGAIGSNRLFASLLRRVDPASFYRGIPVNAEIHYRKLACYDLVTGKLLWDHGLWATDDEHLARASFPSAPVVVGDTVYAGGWELTGFTDSALWAFDARTGERRWRTWLCSGQVELTMFGDTASEPLSSVPAVAGSRVYYCTSFGAVAAVDARTGLIDWLALYDQIPVEPARGYSPVPRTFHWANHPPVVIDGVVVVAPIDSNCAYGFDAETGARLWSIEWDQFGQNLEFIVGAAQGMVVFGGDQLRAVEARSGKFIWPLPETQIPDPCIGRGIVAGGEIYVPCQSAIYRYDILTGAQRGQIAWPTGASALGLGAGERRDLIRGPISIVPAGSTILVTSERGCLAFERVPLE